MLSHPRQRRPAGNSPATLLLGSPTGSNFGGASCCLDMVPQSPSPASEQSFNLPPLLPLLPCVRKGSLLLARLNSLPWAISSTYGFSLTSFNSVNSFSSTNVLKPLHPKNNSPVSATPWIYSLPVPFSFHSPSHRLISPNTGSACTSTVTAEVTNDCSSCHLEDISHFLSSSASLKQGHHWPHTACSVAHKWMLLDPRPCLLLLLSLLCWLLLCCFKSWSPKDLSSVLFSLYPYLLGESYFLI